MIQLERPRARITQQQLAQARLAIEVSSPGEIPVESDCADVGRADDVVAADVVGLECAGRAIAQEHVAAVARLERAERTKRPGCSYVTEFVGSQDRIAADVVNLVSPNARVAHDHERGGAGGQRWVGDRRRVGDRK